MAKCYGASPIVADARARIPLYASDWQITRWSQVSKIASASLFSYIAGIFPALIFGELLHVQTEGLIGIPEVLLSTGGSGIIWSFLAGQPLVIVGVTGPVMMFVSVVFKLSSTLGAPFVPWLGWVAVWSGLMHIFLAVTGAAQAVRYVTAFSGEVFGFFISVSYIYDALAALLDPLFRTYDVPLAGSVLPHEAAVELRYGAAFASLLLALFTCTVALKLHHAEAWRQLRPHTRTFLAAYATAIAVTWLTLLSYIPCFDKTAGSNRLNLPGGGNQLLPSTDRCGACPSLPALWKRTPILRRRAHAVRFRVCNRSWVNNLGVGATGGPFENTTSMSGNATVPASGSLQPNILAGWHIGAAIIPAFLLTILFFFDHNVSSLLSQDPRFHLIKPAAYSLDFLVLGAIVVLTGIFGVPPGNGLIPQAPLHVRALATLEVVKDPLSGERREEFRGVLETRWSNLLQSAAILFTFLIYIVLGTIPQGVLYGIFLFMGITGFDGNSLWTRLWLLITQPDLRPRVPYVTDVRWRSVQAYTLLQLACVIVVFVVAKLPAWISSSAAPYIAVTFPLFIAVFVPIRSHLLPRFFGPGELDLLDPAAPDSAPTLSQTKTPYGDSAKTTSPGSIEISAVAV